MIIKLLNIKTKLKSNKDYSSYIDEAYFLKTGYFIIIFYEQSSA